MKKKVIIILALIFTVFSLSAFTIKDKSNVNSFDRFFMVEYNSALDKAATAVDISLFLTPLIPSISGDGRLGTVATMYLESFALSYAAKEILKRTTKRDRPYMYYPNPPEEKKDDWSKSFPSGHTTLGFMTASFVSYTFSKMNPESKWRIPLTVSLYALATTTAALRILSGSHFMTDVIAGAILGSAIGFAVPYLHTFTKSGSIAASPFSLIFTIGF